MQISNLHVTCCCFLLDEMKAKLAETEIWLLEMFYDLLSRILKYILPKMVGAAVRLFKLTAPNNTKARSCCIVQH